jgi:hypothetical protein
VSIYDFGEPVGVFSADNFNANNNNFSATALALTNNTGVEVSAGFIASRIKRMAIKSLCKGQG